MSASKCIKPHAANRSESRGIVLVIALAALFFPGATWADTVVLDEGALTLKVGLGLGGSSDGETLDASGPGFSIHLVGGPGGNPLCAGGPPRAPLRPGRTLPDQHV